MEVNNVYSAFTVQNSTLNNTTTNPINANTQKPESNGDDEKNKAAVTVAAAIGIAALAIAAIKIGPKVFKNKKAANVLPQEPQKIIKNSVDEIEENIAKKTDKLENPVDLFKEKLTNLFKDKAKLEFDNMPEPKTLKNGLKKYTYEFKDNDGAIHNIKLFVGKDNEFLSMRDKAIDVKGVIRYSKYKKDSFLPIYSSYKSKDGSVITSTYNIKGKEYYKSTKKNYDGTIESSLRNGLFGKEISKSKTTKNAKGTKIKFITDLTSEKPTEYVRIPGTKHPSRAVMPTEGYGKVLVYELDKDGKILTTSTQKIQDYMWDVSAKKVKLTDTLDLKPAKSFGGNLDRDFTRIPHDKNSVRKFIDENAKLDYSSNIIGDFTEKEFDVPERFAVIANNIADKKGSALLCDEVPEVFKDVDTQEIKKALDNFSSIKNKNIPVYEFEISGKKFRASCIGGGQIGSVYKIEDMSGSSAALKIFNNPYLLGAQSGYAEIPVLRQMNKENVTDVPKFFMANPIGKPVYLNGENFYVNNGGWMLSEFITDTTPLKQSGITFNDWLKKHNLVFCDMNDGTMVGKYMVDIGGVTSNTSIKNKHNPVLETLDERLLATIHNGTTIDKLLSI